jgi:uncharacterized protein
MSNIGVNVLEVDGRASPTIVRAPISVAGFLVRSRRGVPDLPIHVRGVADFDRTFGSFERGLYGAHAIRGFFGEGGSEAFVVRIAEAGAAASSVTLDDTAGAATLDVEAGVRGRADPGVWGNSLSVSIVHHPRATTGVSAHVVGSASDPFDVRAPNDTIAVTIDGATAATTITLSPADFVDPAAATAAEVARAINRQTTGLRAGVTANRRLIIASASSGPRSRIAIAAGAGATALGFGGGVNSSGALQNGATLAAPASIAGLVPGSAVTIESAGHAVGTGAMQTSIADGANIVIQPDGGATSTVAFDNSTLPSGFGALVPSEVVAAINAVGVGRGFHADLNSQDRLVVLSDSFGAGSTIGITDGATPAFAALGLTGVTPVAGRADTATIVLVSETDGYVTWTPGLGTATPAFASRIRSAEFDLVVRLDGIEVERWESLSMQQTVNYYAPTAVNDELLGSRYVRVTDLANATAVALDIPAETAAPPGSVPLTGGSDGGTPSDVDFVGDAAARSGAFAFDTVEIQLLASPDSHSQGVASALSAYCESRGDAMFVGSPPDGLELDGIQAFAAPLRARKVYGALYAPWIDIPNPLDTTGENPLLRIPPVGHVLGVYARIGEARGVWKAPAGDEAQLKLAAGVALDMTDAQHTVLVKEGSVNAIRAIPGAGVIIDSSRTLSTDSRWLFVGTRRVFNFVKSSLRDGLRWVAQEPHDEELRRRVKFNVVTPFLLGLWRQGAFGSDPAEDVFTVRCDASNNPPSEVNLGRFNIEVYFYPVKPAETIVIVVGQQESGATASEA